MSDLYETITKVGVLGAVNLGMIQEFSKENPTFVNILNESGYIVESMQLSMVTETDSSGGFTLDYSSVSEKYNFSGPPIIKAFATGDDGLAFNDRIQVNIDYSNRTEKVATGVAFRGPDPDGSSLAYRPAPQGTPIMAVLLVSVSSRQ